MNAPTLDVLSAIELLDGHPDYRILRRFVAREYYTAPAQLASDIPLSRTVEPPPVSRGLVIDLETTGLDTATARIIEIALVPFTFTHDGHVADVGEPYGSYVDPGVPIPAEVTALTGITDTVVSGKAMDLARVERMIAEADLFVAHNAGYDRPIAERYFDSLKSKHFACSQKDVPWKATGARSTVLEYLLFKHCGEFHESHQATDDALATLHVLATTVIDGRPAFAHLREAARTPTTRVYAIGSPFAYKEILKQRGYRWSDGTTGGPKAWFIDVPEPKTDDESTWLVDNAAVYSPLIKRMTARDRYSIRAA